MRVVVVGDLAVVTSFTIDELPRPGSNVIAERSAVYVSGVAANISWCLAGLGIQVAVVGAVGDDAFGRYVRENLRDRGIDLSLVRSVAAPTSVFTILVDSSGERTMIGLRGASQQVTLDATEIAMLQPPWCHVSGYTLLNPDLPGQFRGFADSLARLGIPCSVDLEGFAQGRRRIDLSGVTAICNLDEFRQYFGIETPLDSIDGLPPRLIVKDGASGCYSVDSGMVRRIPARAASCVDSTGAGDAFNAGFIAAALRGLGQDESCRWGNACAALKVAVPGPRVDLTLAAVEQVLSGLH